MTLRDTLLPNRLTTSFEALLPWEDREAFGYLHSAFHDEHRPQGPTEAALVNRLIWVEWRRRRLVVGERAAHLASAQERLSEDYRIRETLNRALVGRTDRAERDELKDGIASPISADAASLMDTDEDETLTLRAAGILEAGGPSAYEHALDALREDTVEWWTDVLADDAANHPEGDAEEVEEAESGKTQPYRADAASLSRFLKDMVLPIYGITRAQVSRRPAIRLQIRGESVDPFRLDRVFSLDDRLDRQFEKALSMLIRLQEMRTASPAR